MNKLRELAAQATPGPWQDIGQVLNAGAHRIGDTQDVCCFGHSGQECDDDDMEQWALADAAFIAYLNPTVALLLADVVDAAELALPVISDMTTVVRMESSGGRISGEAATVLALRAALAKLQEVMP